MRSGRPSFPLSSYAARFVTTVVSGTAFLMLCRYHNRQNITEALAPGPMTAFRTRRRSYLFAKSLWELHRLEIEVERREAAEAVERRSQVLSEIVEHLARSGSGTERPRATAASRSA